MGSRFKFSKIPSLPGKVRFDGGQEQYSESFGVY